MIQFLSTFLAFDPIPTHLINQPIIASRFLGAERPLQITLSIRPSIETVSKLSIFCSSEHLFYNRVFSIQFYLTFAHLWTDLMRVFPKYQTCIRWNTINNFC